MTKRNLENKMTQSFGAASFIMAIDVLLFSIDIRIVPTLITFSVEKHIKIQTFSFWLF